MTPAEFPAIEAASLGVAQLTFVDGGRRFRLHRRAPATRSPETFVPYLLTANHCFSNQAAATSLEAIWHYVRPSCNGPEPNPFGFPRTLGSTLRATGETSDFTLVELDAGSSRRQPLLRLDDGGRDARTAERSSIG